MTHGARDNRENDVVQGATQFPSDFLHIREFEGDPIESPMRSDGLVEGSLRNLPKGPSERFKQGARTDGQFLARVLRLPKKSLGISDNLTGQGKPSRPLVPKKLEGAGGRAGFENGRSRDFLLRVNTHQDVHQVHPGNSIDHAVVDLGNERETVSLQPLDDPHLPQRSIPVEVLLHDPRRKSLQLIVGTGFWKRGVPKVVVEVEIVVVTPDGPLLKGDPGEFLSVAGDPVERGLRESPDFLGPDSTA